MVGSSKQNVAGVARRVSHDFTACDGFEALFFVLGLHELSIYWFTNLVIHSVQTGEWPCDAMKPCSNLFRISFILGLSDLGS